MANEFVARNGVIALDDSQITGSLTVTNGVTGSLFGTASFATNALTASYADNVPATASFATTASYAISASQALNSSTASLATNVVGGANRILFNSATNTTTTSNNLTWTDNTNLLTLGDATGIAGTISKIALYTSSFGGYGLGVSPAQLDYVSDGSHVFYKNGVTPTELLRISNTGDVTITGSLIVTAGITGNLSGTSSFATNANNATTASYVLNAVSASFATQALSASFASNASTATSASYAATSSFASAFTVAGTLTAQTLNVQTVSSSVVYSSGSNIFGNQLSNTQVFTGSVNITGSLTANGPTTVVGSFDVLSGEIKAGRIDTGDEGGQVSFGRASDNLTGWYIDVYGNTSTPSLRFVDVSNASVRMTINGSGNTQMVGSLAVGLISPSAVAGRIDASNDVVAFSTSDKRLKDNIQPIENALEKLNKIGGYTFDWNDKIEIHGYEGHDIGVIAQEIEEVLPETVTTRDNGYKAVKYEKLVAFLIQVDKEQQEIIKDQQRQIDELRELINIYIKTQ